MLIKEVQDGYPAARFSGLVPGLKLRRVAAPEGVPTGSVEVADLTFQQALQVTTLTSSSCSCSSCCSSPADATPVSSPSLWRQVRREARAFLSFMNAPRAHTTIRCAVFTCTAGGPPVEHLRASCVALVRCLQVIKMAGRPLTLTFVETTIASSQPGCAPPGTPDQLTSLGALYGRVR